MGWYHNGTGWGAWLVMSLAMVAFWGLVIWALVVIFRGDRDADTMPSGRRRDPVEILDERFARGETGCRGVPRSSGRAPRRGQLTNIPCPQEPTPLDHHC